MAVNCYHLKEFNEKNKLQKNVVKFFFLTPNPEKKKNYLVYFP